MTNVEIYDTSNSELSSDEYSQEEDDDALMEAAVSKQASPGTATIKAGPDAKPMSQPSEKPDDDGSPTAADAAGKDKVAEDASVVEQEPLPTPAETIRQIRQLDSAPYRNPYIFLKRRSLLWGKHINQCDGKYQLHMKDKKSGGRRRRYSSSSRSLSYSRSNSRSLSRSPSRSRSLDRSGSSERSHSRSLSQSPELICLDDTENEDSPEKPEEAKAANVTPIKENKAKIIKPPPPVQPQLEQQENDKSNENGTSSVLEEFLMIKEPRQPSQAGIELDTLTAGLELEQATADTTLVQQDDVEEAEEPMAVDVTLKRRRSVTPPLSNEKRRVVDDEDDTIEFHPVVAQNSVESTPVLKMQPPRASNVASPAVNSLQSQPAFKLSSPYTLVQPSPNAKQPINLAALSHSLNTPTPPAVPMEISYPTDNLPHTTKSNIVVAPPEQPASSVTVPVYGCSPYASPLQWSQPAQVGHQRDIPAQNDPSRAAVPLQAAPSGALQAPFGTQRVLPAQVGTPRTPAGPTRISLQVNSSRPTVPQQAPPQHQPQAQMQQEQPQVPVNATNFAVPQQPQPRRSETVSTQTQAGQPESPRQKPSAPDLKNPNANFHHRLKELFPDLDAIFKEKLDSMSPDPKSFMEEIDLDIKTLDKLLAQKEDEWNRLLHLRCMKVELRGRMERMERVSIIKKLLPSVINKGCGTAELYELQELLFGEHIHKLPSRLASTSLEQCLNNVEVAQGDIQRLRGALGLKEKGLAASFRNFEEKQHQQNYRRNSLPLGPALMRGIQDVEEELQQLERNSDFPPASKRPRLHRAQERYAHEMSNSTPNLAASSSLNKLQVPGKHPYYSQMSAREIFLENESQLKPLSNSSPLVFQRNQAKRQDNELHSTSYRYEEEEPTFLGASNTGKGLKKKQQHRDASTTNGKEEKICQHCQINEAIYECTSCLNQWYCSSKCQHSAWDSHRIYCGK